MKRPLLSQILVASDPMSSTAKQCLDKVKRTENMGADLTEVRDRIIFVRIFFRHYYKEVGDHTQNDRRFRIRTEWKVPIISRRQEIPLQAAWCNRLSTRERREGGREVGAGIVCRNR